MEEVGFMTYTAASHQGEIKMTWLHQEAAMSSIFMHTLPSDTWSVMIGQITDELVLCS